MSPAATAISIHKYLAAAVLHHDTPMDTAITIGTTAAFIRPDRARASEISRPLRRPTTIIAWVARLASSRLRAKISTASGFLTKAPSRVLVNGMMVMVNRNAKPWRLHRPLAARASDRVAD